MTKKETAKILAVLKVAYPNSFVRVDDERLMVEVWYKGLEDCDYRDVDKAVRAYISTSEGNFAPSIGKVRSLIVKLTRPETGRMTAQEAANLVQKAVANSGYHAPEEFQKLPDVIQRIVRHPQTLFEWSQMDIESFQSVILSNFQRSYQVAVKQDVEEAKLPDDLQKVIGGGSRPRLQIIDFPEQKEANSISEHGNRR